MKKKPNAKKMGRPVVSVPRRAVHALRHDPNFRYSWDQIADKLGISRTTAIRLYKSKRA